jgi:hypothetical protein
MSTERVIGAGPIIYRQSCRVGHCQVVTPIYLMTMRGSKSAQHSVLTGKDSST